MFGLFMGFGSLLLFFAFLGLLVALVFQSAWTLVGVGLFLWYVYYTLAWHHKRAIQRREARAADAATQQASKPVLPTALDD